MEINLSIILLTYNSSELLSKRMLEITQRIPFEGVEIIVIDNGSTDESAIAIFDWWKNSSLSKPIIYQHIPNNVGFCGGMNFGVACARGKNVLLLSNDVEYRSRTLATEVIALLDNSDRILLGGRIVDWDSGWNTFDIAGKKYIIPYCEGYALALSKQAWEVLGGFDENYYPYDYEDVDFSMTALKNKFTLAHLPLDSLFHLHGKTIPIEGREKITLDHKQYFIDKWRDEIPNIVKEST